MDNSQIPDVHSPDFPNTSVLKWTPDGPTVLANMDRATVTTYTSYLAYTHTYGPHVDRLGDLGGKYFWQLPAQGTPFTLEQRALDIYALNDPYYQYRILTLPTGFSIRTGINIPQFSLPGGARQVQFLAGDYVLTANECLQLSILEGKGQN